MKVIYLKTNLKVEIGDMIELNGIKIPISQELINANPDLFEIKDDVPEYVKCIMLYDSMKIGGVVGKIYKVVGTNGSKDWRLDGVVYSVSKSRFTPSTKEEFDRQELLAKAKRDYPIGTRAKSADTHSIGVLKNISYIDDYGCVSCTCDTLTIPKTNVITIYSNELDKWAEILKPILKTEDDIDIYEGDTIYLADSFQVIEIKAHSNTSPTDPEGKLFANEDKANEYHRSIKVMTLGDYENLLMFKSANNNYAWLKIYEPKLYWTKVLSLISSNLNEGFNDNYEISYNIDTKISNCSAGDTFYSSVQFDSETSAKKAISIMGDKLKFIFE